MLARDPKPRPDTRATGWSVDSPLFPWTIQVADRSPLSSMEMESVSAIADKHLSWQPNLRDMSVFGDGIRQGLAQAPTVFFEDQGAIQLVGKMEAAYHEYRSFGLAGPDDCVLLSRTRHAPFESYLKNTVGFVPPNIVEIQGDAAMETSLAAACRGDEEALARIAKLAVSNNGLNFCPYYSTGHSWLLAAEIAERSGARVNMAGPLPQLARLANDKLWFAAQIRKLLDRKAIPPSYSVFGPTGAVALLRKLAREHRKVVAKLPSSAGSKGNVVLKSADVLSQSSRDFRRQLLGLLHNAGWRDRYPLLIGVWEAGALASPSAQIWIPEKANGLPVIAGIFGQALQSNAQTFVGASEIELPKSIEDRFRSEAHEIAYYLQCLGYVGRVSLDALLVGKTLENAAIHWIECNGRWGGVSIPMTIARRLSSGAANHHLTIIQHNTLDSKVPEFEEALALVDRHLFVAGERDTGAVFLEPTGQHEHALTFFVTAPDCVTGAHIASRVLDTLLPGQGDEN